MKVALRATTRRLHSWEHKVTRRITLPDRSRWRWLASFGAHLGDGALWAVVGVALWIWGAPYVRALILIAALAILETGILSTTVKHLVRRPRPQERRYFHAVKYDRYSFPSGHAVRMAVIAVVVWRFIPSLAPIGYPLALLVSLCRVLVGVHYPSDVLAGLLIGSFGAWGVLRWM
jgi:undecaprenyl-diphosphatase